MTKEEAIQLLQQGLFIRHKYFTPDEFMFLNSAGKYEFEDGTTCDPEEFWSNRNAVMWNNGYEVLNLKK